jgi:2-dehydro-3-deoxyphosphooctonate aldolase (KDO 8-P synthase)
MSNQLVRTVKITSDIAVGANNPLLLIAGPCQIESLEHTLKIAGFLKSLAARHKIQLVFKSSYDKANRTSISGARGLGIDAGLKVLETVRSEFDLPVLTDIHTAEEARAAAAVVDVLQTPAFLCRQTDLLLAAGATGKAVNVKKGQFLAPEDMVHVAAKIASTGNHNIMLCERGTCFGYRDLVVDMRSFPIMRSTGYPVIFDGTHSVQSMGGKGGSSGGSREWIPPLVRAASAVGIDGLFLECHDCPEKAPSDGASMLELEQLDKLIESAIKIRSAISDT